MDCIAYHKQNGKQIERNLLKDSIIKKLGIRFFRLKTNESNERERIIKFLA